VDVQHHLADADIIVSLDADFLSCGTAPLRLTREFASRRRGGLEGQTMPRLYVVESTRTLAGATADHRIAMRSSEVEGFARALAAGLGLAEPSTSTAPPHASGPLMQTIIAELQQHRGRSLVMAGDFQPPAVHAIAHLINQSLGNVGRTVVYTEPAEAEPVDQLASLRELTDAMDAGRVDVLLILGGNPAYTTPADLRFEERMAKVGLRIHLGLYDDETSALCHWHVPEAHYLESWGDARAFDGTITLCQPLIAPLYTGKSALEVLASLSSAPDRSGYDILRAYWQRARGKGPAFEQFWRVALHDGFVADTASPVVQVTASAIPAAAADTDRSGLEIVFRPDSTIYDGRFANNGWLQELPKALTTITWDNAALISPRTAERLTVRSEQVVELRHGGRTVRAPAWIVEGHPDESVTVHLGYGRRRGGRSAAGAGFDAYALRTSAAPWSADGLQVVPTPQEWRLAVTQGHFAMEGRHLVRATTLREYLEHPELIHEMGHTPPDRLSLYPAFEYEGYKWGMAIDLNACTGCNACVVACQAENNVPVVGKDQVLRGREMHWLRVDRYYAGDGLDNPTVYHQPVPCMHCEKAPCEVVCPVAATVHSAEGLNEMVYNRCVGTRYCSNNCPYKVRRFNFLLFSDVTTPSLKMLHNPDVTVRTRGVMEKCTYCVQRINSARITAEREGREIRDGDVVTACQAVCPAEAIVFGNINDPNSRVAKLKAEERNYALLADLNTRPRTTYLAAMRNPNPDLDKGQGTGDKGQGNRS
jgi:molybdopterin-containing oxidoreductase family iron-sulfur binding subunit